MNCPSHFPFLKLTHWSKWVFTLFSGTRGHSITFSINTMDMLCFIFCSQDYLNWLTTDILQLFPVMQILTAGGGKGHYFKSIHTCLLHLWIQSGVQTCYRAIACHMTIWNMTFYQGHLQLWVWVSADSVRVNCPLCPYVLQGVSTAIQIALGSCFSLSFSLCGSLMHTHAHTHCTEREKYRI